VVEQEEARVGDVIRVEELASRRAGAPERDRPRARPAALRELADHRWDHVRAGQIEVVERTIEVRRHRADEVRAVLCAVVIAELDRRDFRDGVRAIRRFERSRQQILLLDRLRRESRVDAARSEVEELSHA
jgi:hypothetical protein